MQADERARRADEQAQQAEVDEQARQAEADDQARLEEGYKWWTQQEQLRQEQERQVREYTQACQGQLRLEHRRLEQQLDERSTAQPRDQEASDHEDDMEVDAALGISPTEDAAGADTSLVPNDNEPSYPVLDSALRLLDPSIFDAQLPAMPPAAGPHRPPPEPQFRVPSPSFPTPVPQAVTSAPVRFSNVVRNASS